MTKARDLADLIAAGNPLADGAISVAEISDLTASAADLNNVAGINSSVQTQLDAKAPLASPTLTGTVTMGGTTYPTSDGTEGQVLTTNGSGAVSFADPAGGGSADFVASGAIANGDVVILNSDGTVSVVEQTVVNDSLGTTTDFEANSISRVCVSYDTSTNKVVVAYTDNSNDRLTAAVGTISGTSLSFGTPVIIDNSDSANSPRSTFDSTSNKIVIAYRHGGGGNGRVVVGTVSGTSITFGTPNDFSTYVDWPNLVYDPVKNKTVIFFVQHNNLKAMVATVSGSSISVGSVVSVATNGRNPSAVYDASAGNIVCIYRDFNNSVYGTAIVGTVSGTSISFGSPVVFFSSSIEEYHDVVYDSTNNKLLLIYGNNGYPANLEAVVGTVSGTAISFGSSVVSGIGFAQHLSATYNSTANKTAIGYRLFTSSGDGMIVTATISGNSVSFDTPTTINSGNIGEYGGIASDPSSRNVVFAYPESSVGSANVFSVGSISNNITSTNYIGVADGATSDTATGKITINGGVNEQTISPYFLSNASYDGISFSVSSQEYAPEGLFFKPDGTKMYVVGYGSDAVNEYNLSTAWDITSATYLQNFSILSQESYVGGVSFKPDGTKMYVTGRTSDFVFEYNLSTAWDVTSASYLQSFDAGSQLGNPYDLFFKPDGTKMYVCGDSSKVAEYNLSTAWDVTSASFVQDFGFSSQTSGPNAIYFNNTGTILYMLGDGTNSGGPTQAVFEYSLSTAWDVSSLSYTNTYFQVINEIPGPRALFIKPDGTKMYVAGSDNDIVAQYSIVSFSGYNINSSYYVADDGSFTTTNNGRKIGKAISATKLLVNSNMSGDEMNAYLGGLV